MGPTSGFGQAVAVTASVRAVRSLAPIALLLLLLVACTTPPAVEPTLEPEPSPTETVVIVVPTPVPTDTPQPTATETPAPSLTPTSSPTPVPERVRVFGNGNQAVNMRQEPGTSSGVVKSVPDGTEVTVVGLDRDEGGRIWRNVRDGDAVGWIVSTALRALPTPTVTPSITPTPAATSVPSATAVAATAATAPPGTPAGTPEPERVEIVDTGSQGANIRAEPSTSAQVLQTVPNGTQLTVIGPDREAGGRVWRNVRGQSGTSGWVAGEATRSLATPTRAVTPLPVAPSAPDSTPPPGTAGPDGPVPDDALPEAERVEVYDTGTQGANLRAQPGRNGAVLRSVPDGAVLTIIGEDREVDGIVWRNVQTAEGTTGWLAVEVVRTLVTPTPTPRPGAPGVGAPIVDESLPEDELTEEQRKATPCRPGQLKGDAATGIYYPSDHPEYGDLRQRVRCFDDASRARASGYRPPEPLPAASPSPLPE